MVPANVEMAVKEETVNKEAVTKESLDKEAVNKESLTKEPFTKEPLTKEPLTKEPLTKEPLTKESLTKESLNKEPLTKEPLTKEPLTKEPLTKEPLNKEPLNKEPLNKEPLNKEPLNKEPLNKEPLNKEPLNKESLNKESLNKESFGDTSENTMNTARYLDSLDVKDSSDSEFLDSTETSTSEEFSTQLEVYSASEIRLPFPFNWGVIFQPNRLHPLLEHVIYWRDAKKSAMIFTFGLFILLCIQRLSIIFLVPFLLLHIMVASVAGRMFHTLVRVTRRDQGPDWTDYEHLVVRLPREKVLKVTSLTVERINELLGHLKDLFLFKNAYDSIHFCLFLVSMAMLGKMMNGMTMVTWIYIFVFTIPKIYEMHKLYIDTKLDCMRKNITAMANKFRVLGAVHED